MFVTVLFPLCKSKTFQRTARSYNLVFINLIVYFEKKKAYSKTKFQKFVVPYILKSNLSFTHKKLKRNRGRM